MDDKAHCVEHRFEMRVEKQPEALSTLKDWAAEHLGKGRRSIDFVETTSALLSAQNLHEALSLLGWSFLHDEAYNITGVDQHRTDNAGPDHLAAMRQLAEYVEPGCYFVFFRPPNEFFRWRFDLETIRVDTGGKVVFAELA
jgi:hypothetical protein